MFLTSIFKWLKGLFPKAQRALDKVADLAEPATKIVKAIAALTPTRADDEIVRLFETYGLPLIAGYRETPVPDRGMYLMHVATKELEKKFPQVPTNLIQSVLQLAVTELKSV